MGQALTYSTQSEQRWKRMLIRGIEFGTGGVAVNRIYAQREPFLNDCDDVWSAAISMLKIGVEIPDQSLLQLRSDRPLVVVANHPFGVIDGIVLCRLVSQLRPDFKILINAVFEQVEPIKPHLLPINFMESDDATATNLASRKEAMNTLRRGGAIAVFPSGGVSTSEGYFGDVTDAEWKSFTAKMVRATRADVLPVYFHGANSRLFQTVSQFSQTLRLSLLIYEMRRRIGTDVKLTVGQPIHFEQIEHMTCRQQLTEHLREQTYALGESSGGSLGDNIDDGADQPRPSRLSRIKPVPQKVRARITQLSPRRRLAAVRKRISRAKGKRLHV